MLSLPRSTTHALINKYILFFHHKLLGLFDEERRGEETKMFDENPEL